MSERAKIFVPFDPLKGYRELLRAREREAAWDEGVGGLRAEDGTDASLGGEP